MSQLLELSHRTYRGDNGLLMTAPREPGLAHLARPASHHGVIGPAYVGDPRRAPLYLSGCTNPPTAAAAHLQPRLGLLAQPGNSVHLQAHHYRRWALDNGVFGAALAHYKGRRGPWTDGDTEEYLDYLAKVIAEVDTSNVLFATAPDVLKFVDNPNPELAARKERPIPIGDALATWERSRWIFPGIRALGLPVALVAQDGITDTHPLSKRDWDSFDVLFLGGSDVFKLGAEAENITRQAKLHGKWVHMGRVNSLKRFQIAQRIGCDSADGTFIGFGPDVNLPKVLSWLDRTSGTPAAAVAA